MKKISFSSGGWYSPRCPYCSQGEYAKAESLKEDKGFVLCDDCGKKFYFERHVERFMMKETTYSTSKLDGNGSPVTYECESEVE